jgi:hypothetical protein
MTSELKTYSEYYRHKYLAIGCFFATIMVAVEAGEWRSEPQYHLQTLVFAAIVVLCVVLARYRVLVLGVALAIMALRLLFALPTYRDWELLIILIIVGPAALLCLLRSARVQMKMPPGYSGQELGFDLVLVPAMFAIVYAVRYYLVF